MSAWARWATFITSLAAALMAVLITLAGCGVRSVPQWHPAPKPVHTMVTTGPPVSGVPVGRAGDVCTTPNAKGKTASGTPMTCIQRPGEPKPSWRID